MFLAVINDRSAKTLNIVADITSSPLNMYYTVCNGMLYYGTSLRDVLIDSSVERSIDVFAAKAFLANGYVFGEHTLITGINKPKFAHRLEASQEGVKQIQYQYSLNKTDTFLAKEELIPAIIDSVHDCVDDNENVYMPLSGGFDSNLILDTVRKHTSRYINTITVGGNVGKNEISAVKQNTAGIEGVTTHEVVLDESYFDRFTDIIWRLDGCVFESGVFLQYALAKKAASIGAKNLICGESSDEVQNKYYEESLTRVLSGDARNEEKYFTYSDPFVGTNMLILKKSSVMLNSFGIEGRYPFKNKKFVEAAVSVAKLNGTDKRYYKRQCREHIGPDTVSSLQTSPGTTSMKMLVEDESFLELNQQTEKYPIIQDVLNAQIFISQNERTAQLRKQQKIQRAVSEIMTYGPINGLKKIKQSMSSEPLKKSMKLLYLVIFHELFISSKYDSYFSEDGAPIATKDLLQSIICEK